MTKLKPSTFKHIEAEIASFHETEKEIEKRREEIMFPTMSEELVGGKSNLPSDNVGNLATRLVMDRRLSELERIRDAIQTVYDSLEDKPKQMLRMRYWAKHNAKTWDGIAHEIDVGRMTVFRWRNEIVKAVADKLGWN